MNTLQSLIVAKIINPDNGYRVNGNASRMLSKQPELFAQLCSDTSFLPSDSSLGERIYCIVHDIHNVPKCEHCGNDSSYNKDRKRYNRFCCNKCGTASEHRKTVTASTNLQRYGTTMTLMNSSVNTKARATMLAKYGAEYSGSSLILRERKTNTCLQKYGRSNPAWNHYSSDTIQKLTDREWLVAQHVDLAKSQWCIAEELGISQTAVHYWFNRHNIEATKTGVSKYEHKLVADIKAVLPDINVSTSVRNIIGRKELDLVFPDYNLAVEVNGTYWHSENNGRGRNYHVNKTHEARSAGFKLVHLYEHQLTGNTYDIIVSRLVTMLGGSTRVAGRKCEVVEISNTECNQFLLQNHLQGPINAKVRLGLLHNGMLVAVMSFGMRRFLHGSTDTTDSWELLRFCSVKGVNVIGGASKLFTKFVDGYNPNEVMSFSLLDWGHGDVYNKLGFECVGETGPSFWYISPTGEILNRIGLQKHKLANKISTFDPSKSEWDNLKSNHYDRLWNCGSTKWMWTRK